MSNTAKLTKVAEEIIEHHAKLALLYQERARHWCDEGNTYGVWGSMNASIAETRKIKRLKQSQWL